MIDGPTRPNSVAISVLLGSLLFFAAFPAVADSNGEAPVEEAQPEPVSLHAAPEVHTEPESPHAEPEPDAEPESPHADTKSLHTEPDSPHADTKSLHTEPDSPHADTKSLHTDAESPHADTKSLHTEPEPPYVDFFENDFEPGWFVAAFPIANFSTERGFGVGGYIAAIDRGEVEHAREPYVASLGAQFYQTTGGYAFHKVLLDFRNLGGKGIRLDVFSGYEAWDNTPYFGAGGLRRRVPPEAEIDHGFHDYREASFWFVPMVYVPLGETPWQVLGGGTFRYATVSSAPDSLLSLESPPGSGGGPLVELTAGMSYSTLRGPLSPLKGFESEVTLRGGSDVLGSRWSSIGLNMMHRQIHPLVTHGRLTFAWLSTVDFQEGEPFFQSHRLGGGLRLALGGKSILRGYPVGRIRGNIKAVLSGELRWIFWDHALWGQRISWMFVPFVDAGNAWTWEEVEQKPPVYVSFGLGPRWVLNDAFLVRFDLTCALERFDEPKVNAEEGRHPSTKPVFGAYLVMKHPF